MVSVEVTGSECHRLLSEYVPTDKDSGERAVSVLGQSLLTCQSFCFVFFFWRVTLGCLYACPCGLLRSWCTIFEVGIWDLSFVCLFYAFSAMSIEYFLCMWWLRVASSICIYFHRQSSFDLYNCLLLLWKQYITQNSKVPPNCIHIADLLEHVAFHNFYLNLCSDIFLSKHSW